MKGNDQAPIPPEIEFLSTCIVAVLNSEYTSALHTMKEGLIELSKHPGSTTVQQFAGVLYVVFGALESNLKKTFGDSLDEKMKELKSPEVNVETRCSFCGKERTEVERIIAGPGVFICSECIEICNKIIASDIVE